MVAAKRFPMKKVIFATKKKTISGPGATLVLYTGHIPGCYILDNAHGPRNKKMEMWNSFYFESVGCACIHNTQK